MIEDSADKKNVCDKIKNDKESDSSWLPARMSRRHQQAQLWEFLNYMKARSHSDRERKLSQVLKYIHRTPFN